MSSIINETQKNKFVTTHRETNLSQRTEFIRRIGVKRHKNNRIKVLGGLNNIMSRISWVTRIRKRRTRRENVINLFDQST
jgi:hypothetical protein